MYCKCFVFACGHIILCCCFVCAGFFWCVFFFSSSSFFFNLPECGSLPAPDHGFVDTSSGTTFGETASYVCNNGYDLIGMATRSCLENGTWSELAPTCRIKGEKYKVLF